MTTALDHYRALELPYGADKAELQRAFRRLVKLHHPDRQRGEGDGGARFREIVAAYEYLKTYTPEPQVQPSRAAGRVYTDAQAEGLRQMRARKIRIYPRSGRRAARQRPAETPLRSVRPRVFLARPTMKEHYYIYVFYIASIGLVILVTMWKVISELITSEPKSSRKPPVYSKEQKEQILRAYMEGVNKERKAARGD